MMASVDECILRLTPTMGDNAFGYLLARVKLYAYHVSQWPQHELQYVPNAKRWFDERRYQQDEKFWQRVGTGFAAEREQIRRISNRIQ